eukprot:CAMPEP_0176454916 /NCGR_PEP_ID=MMETSP0127-20121128/30278_1 /TAXON_ID=938130 /ORGANISM="Platyophrya macrostoma, Strain WH" /LENGTH=145 /DNA_ID=CAMNT_0017844377 /DNA_START=38 /DNA_END=475 /DNA_ORIENTATION=-
MSDTDTAAFSRSIPKNSAAWDDTELIAAWNEQLNRMKEGGGVPEAVEGSSSDVEDEENFSSSGSSSCADIDEQQDAGVGKLLPVVADAVPTRSPLKRQREDTPDVSLPPFPAEVPQSMHRLLRAWFLAGFETGHYVGSQTAIGST